MWRCAFSLCLLVFLTAGRVRADLTTFSGIEILLTTAIPQATGVQPFEDGRMGTSTRDTDRRGGQVLPPFPTPWHGTDLDPARAPRLIRLASDRSSSAPACDDLGPPAGKGDDRCIEMPPAPHGDRLVYSGLLTLLAVPALRSARQLSWGAVPVWFHTAGPDQIGHRMMLDPTADETSFTCSSDDLARTGPEKAPVTGASVGPLPPSLAIFLTRVRGPRAPPERAFN